MLCLSDFVTCRKRYYNQSRRGLISVLKHCRKRKFRIFLYLTLISKIFMMSRFSDFEVCSTNLYIWSSGNETATMFFLKKPSLVSNLLLFRHYSPNFNLLYETIIYYSLYSLTLNSIFQDVEVGPRDEWKSRNNELLI